MKPIIISKKQFIQLTKSKNMIRYMVRKNLNICSGFEYYILIIMIVMTRKSNED